MDHFHQRIPRPSAATRLSGAPWANLDLALRSHVLTATVRKAFGATDLRAIDVKGARAAVLVAVLDRAGEAYLILTRRALDLARDPGLIALPGGFVEDGEHPVDAALREADEEIGLDSTLVDLIGCLGTFERPRTGIPVVAYVGIVDHGYELRASKDEVHEIFEIPLASLLEENSSWQERWTVAESDRIIRFFAHRELLGANVVWGLTAAIVWTLLEEVTFEVTRLDRDSS